MGESRLKAKLVRLPSRRRRRGGRVDKAAFTRDAYAQWAGSYDADAAANLAVLVESDVVLESIDPKPEDVILDAGCGTGRYIGQLMDRCTIVGFDSSPEMLEIARSKYPTVELTQADLTASLPYPDAMFHKVLSSLVLSHVRDLKAVLAEFRRVVKPGGLIFITDFVRHGTLDWEAISYQSTPSYTLDFATTSRIHPIARYVEAADVADLQLDRIRPLRVGENARPVLTPESFDRWEATWGSVLYEMKRPE